MGVPSSEADIESAGLDRLNSEPNSQVRIHLALVLHGSKVPDNDPVPTPEFKVTRSKEGAWYVIADWPNDGQETAKVGLTEEECQRWLTTMGPGWVAGRKPPF